MLSPGDADKGSESFPFVELSPSMDEARTFPHQPIIRRTDMAAPRGVEENGIKILTIDKVDNGPVPGVFIFRQELLGQVLLGETNQKGELFVEPKAVANGSLSIRSQTHTSRNVQVQGFTSNTEIVLSLDRGASLSGKVQCLDQAANLEEIQVVAWPSQYPPSGQDWVNWWNGNQAQFSSAFAASDGSFSLSGLNPHWEYSVTAGGNGLLAQFTKTGIVPGREMVNIDVRHLFGGKITLLEDKEPISEITRSSTGLVWSVPGVRSDSIASTEDPLLLLAGIEDYLTQENNPLSMAAFYFLDTEQIESPPTLFLLCDIIGYKKVSTEIGLARVSDGLLEHFLQLEDLAVERANLIIEFGQPTGKSPNPINSYGPAAYLYLTDLDGGRYQYSISEIESTTRIEGIPTGQYSYQVYFINRFCANVGHGAKFAGQINITRGDNSVDFPMNELGALDFDFLLPNDEPYLGKAVVRVTCEDIDSTFYYIFSKGPYRIAALPAGKYNVDTKARFLNGDSYDLVSGSFQIFPESVNSFQFRLPSEPINVY